jgi:glutathione peroxidase
VSILSDLPVTTLDGGQSSIAALIGGKAALLVNVASRCGLTPQYGQLEALHEEFASRGFTVVGFPCNQFYGQEPGSAQEIAEFCSTTYGVTFPMSDKIDVNGDGGDEGE